MKIIKTRKEIKENREKLDKLTKKPKKEPKKSKRQLQREAREEKYRNWEKRTINKGMVNPYMGIYIHIPFCSKKCDYCDFVSYSMDEQAQKDYLEALFKEIDIMAEKMYGKQFNTLYIGGGTPSFVYDGFIRELSRKIFSSFEFVGDVEYTIEINPSSITEKKLLEYMQSGVNRISVGVQCLDEKLLRHLGRIQSMENIDKTFALLKKMEFINVGADIMIGLPNQTIKSVKDTVNYVLEHNVKHVSIYTLQVENHTLLFDKVQAGKVKPLDDDMCIKMYNTVYKMLKKAGFVRYEVSNFAKPTFESKHNFKYWNNVEYLGLGVSAHSYLDGYRFGNTKRLDTYIDRLNKGELPIAEKEFLTKKDRRTERIMLSLRMPTGLDLNKFAEDFKEDLLRTRFDVIKRLEDMKLIKVEDGFLKITDDNFYVSNRIILELL